MRPGLDHIVYACRDLAAACSFFEDQAGIRPLYGGRHEGGTTHNALVPLAGDCYLEILAPLSEEPALQDEWSRLAFNSVVPRVIAYCLRSAVPLEDIARHLPSSEWTDTEVRSNGRQRPDGVWLRWRWVAPTHAGFAHAFPFFIDWLDTPHPSGSRIEGTDLCRIRHFEIRHPQADRLIHVLRDLQSEVHIVSGEPQFVLELETPRGLVGL